VTGGYALGRAPNKITLRDVAELLEGVDIDRCSLSLEDQCPVLGRCSIQRSLTSLERQFLDLLESVTVAKLSKEIITTVPKAKRTVSRR
jgi:DNA-binding IscR family transcriptional regulator